MLLSVTTKFSNLVIFKRWNGFNCPLNREELSKNGAWAVFGFKCGGVPC